MYSTAVSIHGVSEEKLIRCVRGAQMCTRRPASTRKISKKIWPSAFEPENSSYAGQHGDHFTF